MIAASLVACATAGIGVLHHAGGQALLDTFPASTFFVTATAGYVCLQAKPEPGTSRTRTNTGTGTGTGTGASAP